MNTAKSMDCYHCHVSMTLDISSDPEVPIWKCECKRTTLDPIWNQEIGEYQQKLLDDAGLGDLFEVIRYQ